MAGPTTKAELLEMMQRSYTDFEALLAPLSAAQLTAPGVSGDWSIKDILVHLAAWQERAASIVEAAGRNERVQLDPPVSNDEEMNRFNDATFAANRSRPLAQAQQDFRTSYQRLHAATEALNEEDLFNSTRFAWRNGHALWETVKDNTYGHYDEHRTVIVAWLQRGM